MPIEVRYSPPASTLYAAANQAGYGQFLERRRAEQLQLAELAQRDLAQRRALAGQLYSQAASQAFNREQNAFDRQMRAGLAGAEMQLQNQRIQEDRRHQIDRDLWMDRQQEERDNRLLDRQNAAQVDLAVRAAEDDRRAMLMQQYEDGQLTLDMASRTRLGKIRSDMAAVRKSTILNPQEKNAKLLELDAQFWDIMGNPSPQLPGERRKAPQEKLAESSVTTPVYALNPDGSPGQFMGYRHSTLSMRNGVEQWQHNFEPYKPPTGNKIENPLDAFREFAHGFIGKTKDGKTPGTKVPYTTEDIKKLWKQEQELTEWFSKGDKKKNPAQDAYDQIIGQFPEAIRPFMPQAPQQIAPGGFQPGMSMGVPPLPPSGSLPRAPGEGEIYTTDEGAQEAINRDAYKKWDTDAIPVRSAAEAEARGPGVYILPNGQAVVVTK